jgi:thioesterase domain-containing protein
LVTNRDAAPGGILVPIQPNGDARPVFGVPGAGGSVLSLHPLSRALGAGQPFYGLQAVGLDGRTPPLDSVGETAIANIAALKQVQPAGPYSLLGHSYGGVVAYEMARVLLEQGEDVASLTLLDVRAPSAMQEAFDHDESNALLDACTVAANASGTNVEIDLDGLRQLPDDAKIQYLVGLLNDHGVESNAEQFNALYNVYRANLRCYRNYAPLPLSRDIEVSLYRATQAAQHGAVPRDYGWTQLLRAPIRIHDVDADHFSILKKVTIQAVAAAPALVGPPAA